MIRRFLIVAGPMLALTCVAPVTAAPLGTAITYQGQLRQSGVPYAGTADLIFTLYDAASGGPVVAGPVTLTNVSVVSGLFTVQVDFGAAAFAGDARWLGIQVTTPSGSASYATLSPRQAITATPYALFAANAAVPVPLTLSGTSGTHIIRGENASTAGASVGVFGFSSATTGFTYGIHGVTASASGNGVVGQATAATGTTYGVVGESFSSDGTGVYGYNNTATSGAAYGGRFESASTSGTGAAGFNSATTGFTYGLYGQSISTSGSGVSGYNFAASGTTYGGRFETASTGGRGVFGRASAATGFTLGVYGLSDSTDGIAVLGTASAASGTNYGVFGQSNSTSGRAVYGLGNATSGSADAIFGESKSTSGRGSVGYATATSGPTYGVWGQSESTAGRGVLGLASATSGVTYGVQGQSDSPSGTGVLGLANAGSGTTYGVFGQSSSTSGRGVYGVTLAATGFTYGVSGATASTSGNGVVGLATAATGATYGVVGESQSSSGTGVYGYSNTATSGGTYGGRFESTSTSGRGVFGWAKAASGVTYGVAGQAALSGWAVYAFGDMGASGTKSFRIDHPDDPENKYLLHYSTESPEVLNAYSGNVTLDGAGEAVVELPRYFAKINRDPRYTLTAVGAPMPMLHVAEEIDEIVLSAGAKAAPGEAASLCSFRIAGGAPGKKVSWRVEAIRNDKWVQQRAIPVEVEKQGLEKGTYEHPEFYGQPKERGVNFRAESARPSSPAIPDAGSASAAVTARPR